MYYVQILACMWVAIQTGSPFGSLGSLRSLASVHVESACEISSILSLVPDSPNHPTCLPDRARRLPDMSPIRHQASLANSMLIFICRPLYFNKIHRFDSYTNANLFISGSSIRSPISWTQKFTKPWFQIIQSLSRRPPHLTLNHCLQILWPMPKKPDSEQKVFLVSSGSTSSGLYGWPGFLRDP